MSFAHIKGPDELVQCPYDPAHRIKQKRLTRHLILCQKNHPNANFVWCSFNSQHRVKAADIEQHLLECPDRVLIDREIFCPADSCGNVSNASFESLQNESSSTVENWDTECFSSNNSTYDPTEHMKNLKFQNPASYSYMKPAEKRAFRKQLQTKGFQDNDDYRDPFEDEDAVLVLPTLQRRQNRSRDDRASSASANSIDKNSVDHNVPSLSDDDDHSTSVSSSTGAVGRGVRCGMISPSDVMNLSRNLDSGLCIDRDLPRPLSSFERKGLGRGARCRSVASSDSEFNYNRS